MMGLFQNLMQALKPNFFNIISKPGKFTSNTASYILIYLTGGKKGITMISLIYQKRKSYHLLNRLKSLSDLLNLYW